MPALVQVCAKGISKAGKSAFKFNGKDYDVKLDKPLSPKVDRPKPKEPEPVPKKPNNCKRNKAKRAPAGGDDKKTKVKDGKIDTKTVTKTCDAAKYTQACYHYKSVVDHNPALKQLTCIRKENYNDAGKKTGEAARPLVKSYNDQHHTDWSSGWMQEGNLQCQRDEYPPADIWQARDKRTWIRLLRKKENGGAGNIWKGVCPPDLVRETRDVRSLSQEVIGCRTTTVYEGTVYATQTVFEMDFDNMDKMPPDYGITANPCWPATLGLGDPGFALLTDDAWYGREPGRDTNGALRRGYAKEPGAAVIAGKTNSYGFGFTSRKRKAGTKKKRDGGEDEPVFFMLDGDGATAGSSSPPGPEAVRVDLGNSTRRPTEEELLAHFGYLACTDKSCDREMAALGYASLPYARATAGAADQVEAALGPAATTTAAVAAADGSRPQTLAGSEDPRLTRWAADALATATDIAAEVAAALITPAPVVGVDGKAM